MEISINIVYAIVVVAVALLFILGLKLKINKQAKIGIYTLSICLLASLGLLAFASKKYASYELGAYPEQEHYKLAVSVEQDGKVQYIDPSDFTLKETTIDLSKAQIGGRITALGYNNKYKKYLDLGFCKLTWDSLEDVIMLSKYDAIQLGYIKATGAEDEKKFNIATSSEALEELQKSVE